MNKNTGHESAAASASSKLLLAARGFTFVRVLGFVDGAVWGESLSTTSPMGNRKATMSPLQSISTADPSMWSFGVSGEVESIPPDFRARTIMRLSLRGLNAAVDGWGSTLRAAYNTSKKTDEDLFATTLSVFTDNGAATLGLGWPSQAPPPPGNYRQLNWSAVNLTVLNNVLADVRGTGVAPRGLQWDAWWYPTDYSNKTEFLCGIDWTLPPEHYSGGLGPAFQKLGVPFMLYLPAVCPGPSQWQGRYSFQPKEASVGFQLPDPTDAFRFFSDLFAYGQGQCDPKDHGQTLWPGVSVPPMVRAGWSGGSGGGTVAAYETDFFWNMIMETPELRSKLGATERLIRGMAEAALEHNMTVQICAGEMPDFLVSLTMPSITQGRGSIDYVCNEMV